MNRILNTCLYSIIFFIMLGCTNKNEKNEMIKAYNDILPEFFYYNPVIRAYFELPSPPYENDNENINELSEIERLNKRIDYLEWNLHQLQLTLNRPKEFFILNKLLPIHQKYFKKTELSVYSTLYDTTWISSEIVKSYETTNSIKLFQNELNEFNYKIILIDQIPDYDSSLNFHGKEPFVDFCYLQFSQIVFNKEKNKGMFYYGVTNKERISSNFDYQYIIKENNRWKLAKK